MSESRVCRLLDLNRKTKRYVPKLNLENEEIMKRLIELAGRWKRFGYRRLHVLLKRHGYRINVKRTYRLYSKAGLGIRRKRKKLPSEQRGRPEPAANIPNTRWAMDFVSDRLKTGRRVRILTVLDESSRECLACIADTSLTGQRVARILDQLVETNGRPKEILTDNGPEFTSNAMSEWTYRQEIRHRFIDPGRPIQNSHIESFNGKLRDEFLNEHWFASLEELQRKMELWRNEYNFIRPHSALGNMPPVVHKQKMVQLNAEFAG